MTEFIVEFFEDSKGVQPARELILSLDEKSRAKVLMMVALLQVNGNTLGMPYSKHIADGIFELRVRFATNSYRVLYFFCDGQLIIITNGFIKKTRKTPPAEIKKAKVNRLEYQERQKYNGTKV